MSEHPILFNSEMVRAILDGRKTRTRRIVNCKRIAKQTGCSKGRLFYSKTFKSWAVDGNGGASINLINCPYGKVGDRLWVRETWRPHEEWDGSQIPYLYKADYPQGLNVYWKASIHMPKKACRLHLEITDIRVERVQDISPRDAMDEGIGRHWDGHQYWWENYQGNCDFTGNNEGPINSFHSLWDSINGMRRVKDEHGNIIHTDDYSWKKNPFCWVVSFCIIYRKQIKLGVR